MNEKDIEQINQIIANLKDERRKLKQQIKIIDDTLKTISRMLDLIIQLE